MAFLGNNVSSFLSLIIGIWNHRIMEWLRLKGTSGGQVGRGFEQPDAMKDVPAHGRGVGLDDL